MVFGVTRELPCNSYVTLDKGLRSCLIFTMGAIIVPLSSSYLHEVK